MHQVSKGYVEKSPSTRSTTVSLRTASSPDVVCDCVPESAWRNQLRSVNVLRVAFHRNAPSYWIPFVANAPTLKLFYRVEKKILSIKPNWFSC
jgi:hypothetical protein